MIDLYGTTERRTALTFAHAICAAILFILLSLFAVNPAAAQCNLDVDSNGSVNALTDGLLILRASLGLTGNALTQGAIGTGALRSNSTAILNFINANKNTAYDFDASGQFDPQYDSLLILRSLFGLNGTALTNGASASNAYRKSASDINAYVAGNCPSLPQLPPAGSGNLISCSVLASYSYAQTSISQAISVAAGIVGNVSAPAHCWVKGVMQQRVSPVNGQTYGINFEMRLPNVWNGRFFHQGNGGTDGVVIAAFGPVNGSPNNTSALKMGFAVISSDSGHVFAADDSWGLDQAARVDYGYQAVNTLTPMAKGLIQSAYGRKPDRSYFGGCSSGGRHGLVTAARLGNEYDGILSGSPAFHLTKAVSAHMWNAQQYAGIASSTIASGPDAGFPDITSSISAAEFSLIGSAIVSKCDALDGVSDHYVADTRACQANFNLQTDVPTCPGARDGNCLTSAQKNMLIKMFAGATDSVGTSLYARYFFDPGIAASNFAASQTVSAVAREPGYLAYVFTTPPLSVAAFQATTGLQYALSFSMDTDYPKMFAINAAYSESPWSWSVPPNEADLSVFRNRGGKIMLYHGVSDPVFSIADTISWYDALAANAVTTQGGIYNFARLYPVPGMPHCSGGPATDQFDLLTPLVNWVENGQIPGAVVATARGPGAQFVNSEVPASWSATRTRLLCPYPRVGRYSGIGNIESSASFVCQ